MKISFIQRLCLVICFLLGIGDLSSAQLFLEQAKVKLSIKPGEKISQTLTIHNQADKPAKVKVYWEDFVYQPPFDGSKKFFPLGTMTGSAGSWVSFSPNEFILPAFGKKEITSIVSPPSTIKAGGHYGVLFFEKNVDVALEASRGLNVVTRLGCLFFLETEDRSKEASLEDIAIDNSQFRSTFVNKGNVVLIPEGIFYIMDQDDLVVDRGSIPKVYVPPGEKSDYKFDFSKDIVLGRYKLVLTMDLEDGDVLVKEIDFEKRSSTDFQILKVSN